MTGGLGCGRARRAGGACLLGSLALHATLLLVAPAAAQLKPGGPAPGQSPRPKALMVRQVFPESGEVKVEVAQLSLEPARVTRVAPLAMDPIRTQVQQQLVPVPVPVADASGADDAVYLPRRQLDQPPQLMAPVDLPWPEDGPPAGHFSEVVSLFIDEAGTVQRVRMEGPGLPDSLQAVAQEVFLQARFSPGMLAGKPVRSWIRLEVVFDAASAAVSRGVRR